MFEKLMRDYETTRARGVATLSYRRPATASGRVTLQKNSFRKTVRAVPWAAARTVC